MSSRQALIVMASPQLNGPATCGSEPAKSTVMLPSPTVIAISTRTGLVERDAVVVEVADRV